MCTVPKNTVIHVHIILQAALNKLQSGRANSRIFKHQVTQRCRTQGDVL